jgi:hypothetical protein
MENISFCANIHKPEEPCNTCLRHPLRTENKITPISWIYGKINKNKKCKHYFSLNLFII